MKRTTIYCTLIIALWLALVSQVGAQGVLKDDQKSGAPNAWGTPDKFLAFKATLDKYAASLEPMPCADLQKAYTDLTAKAAGNPALGDSTKQAGAEHTMYVAATRAEMDKPTKCGTGKPPGPAKAR